MTPSDRQRKAPRMDSARSSGVELELRQHIEGRIEEYVAQGMTQDQARELAHRRFGDFERLAAQCHAEAGADGNRNKRKVRDLMSSILQDIRYAIRALAKRPGHTSAMLITLVLAIGAATAVFSVVNGVLLHPLPHPDPDELVLVLEVDRRPGFFEDHNNVTAANYADWREQNEVFQAVAAYQYVTSAFRGEGDPEMVRSVRVSADFFKALGVNAAIGRTFLPEEEQPGNHNVAMLSHHFWLARFGGDSTVIGRPIRLGSRTATIVGVMPHDFDFLNREASIWTPLSLRADQFQNRRSHLLRVVARMKPGMSVERAQQDMDRVVDGLREAYPEFLTGWGVNVVSLTDEVVGKIRPALLVLLGAAVFVLLIAAVNTANLMLTRTAGEQREVAIRAALGAGQARLVRQKLTESLVLGVTGGLLGLFAAVGATRLLLVVAPGNLPQADLIGVDGRVLSFAVVVSLVTGLVFGIGPAFRTTRTDVAGFLREGGRNSTGTRVIQRLRSGFVVAQLAFSIVLLVSAGLMLGTFASLMSVDPGFNQNNVMTMKLTLPFSTYRTPTDQAALFDQLIPQLEGLPQVQSVGATSFLPLRDNEWTWSVYIEGRPIRDEGEKLDYGYHVVSGEYFRTMDIALKQGRLFNQFDRADVPPVAIVNEAFVQRFFEDGENPVGQRFSILSREDVWVEIVGVTEDVHHYALETDPQPAYYGPYAQIPWNYMSEMSLVLRTSGEPTAVVSSVRQVVRNIAPTVVVSDVRTMRERVAGSVARSRFAMILLGVFAGVALALATVGIYGVISYTVGQRSQEIGIRVALGAKPGDIVGQFIAGGVKLTAAGVAAGLLGAVVFTRFQASLLYGVTTVDPITYGAVTAILTIVALVATYLPARRASRTDPMTVLREE